MVLINTKGVEKNHQFVFETTVETSIDKLKNELVELYNFRYKILKLADAALEVASHGPLRPEELRGISEEELKLKLQKNEHNDFKVATNPDTYNFRTGIPPAAEFSKRLKEVCENAKSRLSAEKAEKNKTITLEELKHLFKLIVDALKECYPRWDDLAPHDTTRLILEKENFLKDELLCEETSIWWAGKDITKYKYLKELIGKNEKSKLKVILQPTKSGPPVREPRIDEETYKAMLAYYHKKSKEEKELEEDDDDSYLNSEWANPLSLQKQLHGNLSNIKWRP